MSSIKTAADQCFDEIVAIRRDIHRHPEVGRTEVRTSALIRKKLGEYGVDSIESPCPTAVVGILHGAEGPGKCIAIRADIDALPVTEQTGLSFASENAGVMHACGHDMHVAMLLGVAKVLCGMRDQIHGTVKFIFQHSEDTLPGGAKELVENGVMENPKVDAIIGLHVMPDAERVGQIGVRAGALTTAVDLYDVSVIGKGGHGSAPHTTNDPILAAAQMIVTLQQIVARRVDPLDTAIFSIGSIHSGDAPNIIPDQAKFSGIARTYTDTARETVRQQVVDIARGIGALSGCQVTIDHTEGYPTAVNDKALVAGAKSAISAQLGEDAVVELENPFSFSEDFSYYGNMTGIPSAYFMLFAGYVGDELVSLHNPKCALREEAMPYGITALASIAVDYLNQ
ncbi:MAG: M20 family metallopeptidase [Acetanaerobacterium sp.]